MHSSVSALPSWRVLSVEEETFSDRKDSTVCHSTLWSQRVNSILFFHTLSPANHSTSGIVWRTVWKICLLMFGCKGLNKDMVSLHPIPHPKMRPANCIQNCGNFVLWVGIKFMIFLKIFKYYVFLDFCW